VCGVAVKAERPEAEPRTYGLEGDAVGAMLVEPGRGNVQDVESGRVFTTVVPVVGRAGVRLPVIHSPRER
jgi:hypothetical protein